MFNSLTDPVLKIAILVGVVALILTLISALQIMYLRVRLRRTQRINAATIAKWRPILHAAIVGEVPMEFPPLPKQEHIPFLQLWIYVHESLRGESVQALNKLAHLLQCDRIAHALLANGDRSQQLLSILVLGKLRDKAAWSALRSHANAADSIVSIYAFWALVRIDPSKAIGEMIEPVTTRDDWPVTRLVLIFQEAGEACIPAMNEALRHAETDKLPRLLQIFHALRMEVPSPTLSHLLRHSSVEVLTAALKLVDGPDLLPQVVEFVAHPDWQIRMRTAQALGRIGGKTELPFLIDMLGDSHWWVRFRAAEALLSLPFLSREGVRQIMESLTDRFAIDIMQHVMTEKGLA